MFLRHIVRRQAFQMPAALLRNRRHHETLTPGPVKHAEFPVVPRFGSVTLLQQNGPDPIRFHSVPPETPGAVPPRRQIHPSPPVLKPRDHKPVG